MTAPGLHPPNSDRTDAGRDSAIAAILDIAADAIITIDANQRILHFNRGAEEIFGWRAEELRGRPLGELIPVSAREIHARHVAAFRDGEETSRRMAERRPIFGVRRDGSEFSAEASISKLVVDGQLLMTVILRDITARQRLADDATFLNEAQAAFDGAFEDERLPDHIAGWAIKRLGDACVLLLMEGSGGFRCVVKATRASDEATLEELCEVSHDGPRNWPFPLEDVALVGDAVKREHLAAGWETEGAPSLAVAELAAKLEVRAFAVLPLMARGKVQGAITIVRQRGARTISADDLAFAKTFGERAALVIDNARLYHVAQRATVARDEVLSVVSHDLRNPLSAIRMCARVLADQPPDDESRRRHLASSILDGAAQMQRLIQDLLDASLLESGHLTLHREPSRLEDVVDRVIAMVRDDAKERGLTLLRRVPAELPPFDIDPTRLTQAVANLAANAVKFTGHGGCVTIGVRAVDGAAEIAVTDTGIGISPRDLTRIFDRYWHARRADRTLGTGLGLAIAKGIVEAHGGRLRVVSTLGAGSTFTCEIPLTAPA